MNSIQRIIEIPLFELQTDKARNMDISISNCCCICGNKIKEGVKIATNYVNDFEITAIRMASEKMCDGVICGHIHQPADRIIGSKHYLNSGDWVENMTAICIDINNIIEIKTFK
jgi:UDP-2,3-diacylglucosamine pyrophosphatase LpxH